MGESIDKLSFTEGEAKEFQNRLRQETKILKNYFESREFEYTESPFLGLEVEGCLIDSDFLPSPTNKEFLETARHPLLVEELSKFNFEINVEPQQLSPECFHNIHNELLNTWEVCTDTAKRLNISPILVGIQPVLRDQCLQPEYMSDGNRYRALNDQLLKLRKGKPITVDIKGSDHFQMTCDHVMLEAAATSIQVHIQANQENISRVYNASQIISAPCVALAANSPFLYGNDLWDETRIPLFEQAVNVTSFRNKHGQDVGRVGFGSKYTKHSVLELFLENLDGYPPLIPVLFDENPERLRHLRFHNGTIWRWNRPIIGINSEGKPHIRIEQRVMASGPSIEDIVSNMAFSVGLTQYFSNLDKAPEESMTFTDCRNNFYQAAKYGLNASIKWFGKEVFLSKLIYEDLIPKAKEGLLNVGIDKDEVNFYIDQNIHQRVLSGQNGAQWQRSYVNIHGKDFQKLSEAYLNNLESGSPVHKWKI